MRAVLTLLLAVIANPLLAAEAANAAAQRLIDANRLEASYNAGSSRVRDGELDAYLGTLVKRLADTDPAAAKAGFRIHALQNTLPYAFALDNGALYVSTGLLARLQDESQLATLLATEMAAVLRQDNATSVDTARRRMARKALPDILLLTVTAGLAVGPLVRSESAAQQKLDAQLRLESDQLALKWLQQAGFDPAAAPQVYSRLLDTLNAENRFGSSDLNSRNGLETRRAAILRALPTPAEAPQGAQQPAAGTAAAGTPAASGTGSELDGFARRFTLDLAYSDLSAAGSTSFGAVADRLEQQWGVNGPSAFLRAEYARQGMRDASKLPEVIAGYEHCVGFSDAPAQAYRELGYLYRRSGDLAASKRSFWSYLQHAPDAVDAPIILSYIEAK